MLYLSDVTELLRRTSFVLFFLMYSSVNAETYSPKILVDSLHYPWGIEFLDKNTALVTEKSGGIKRIYLGQGGRVEQIKHSLEVVYKGQGGLLDIALDPNFTQNNRIYLSYSKVVKSGFTTAVAAGQLVGDKIENLGDILIARAESTNTHHYGSRLAFDHRGLLYISIGDRGHRDLAQDLTNHKGKVLRVHTDGRVPKDNPFFDVNSLEEARPLPEIFSFGHRNPQGMTFDPLTQYMWIHEHGPRGGDELNLLQAGKNYGWPVITYGREYSGFSITDQTHHEHMMQPVKYWDPSIAPSGLAIYRGDRYRAIHNSFLVGALKYRQLVALDVGNIKRLTQRVLEKKESPFLSMAQQVYLTDLNLRIRDVGISPDGFIYLLTDSSQGSLIQLMPTQ